MQCSAGEPRVWPFMWMSPDSHNHPKPCSRQKTPAHGNNAPRWQCSHSRGIHHTTKTAWEWPAQRSKELESSTGPPNAQDPNPVNHLWDMPDQVRSIITWQDCRTCPVVSGTGTMVQILWASTQSGRSHGCLIEVGSGEFEGRVHSFSYLSCSLEQFFELLIFFLVAEWQPSWSAVATTGCSWLAAAFWMHDQRRPHEWKVFKVSQQDITPIRVNHFTCQWLKGSNQQTGIQHFWIIDICVLCVQSPIIHFITGYS